MSMCLYVAVYVCGYVCECTYLWRPEACSRFLNLISYSIYSRLTWYTKAHTRLLKSLLSQDVSSVYMWFCPCSCHSWLPQSWDSMLNPPPTSCRWPCPQATLFFFKVTITPFLFVTPRITQCCLLVQHLSLLNQLPAGAGEDQFVSHSSVSPLPGECSTYSRHLIMKISK